MTETKSIKLNPDIESVRFEALYLREKFAKELLDLTLMEVTAFPNGCEEDDKKCRTLEEKHPERVILKFEFCDISETAICRYPYLAVPLEKYKQMLKENDAKEQTEFRFPFFEFSNDENPLLFYFDLFATF